MKQKCLCPEALEKYNVLYVNHCTKFGIYLTLHFSVKSSNDFLSAHLHNIYSNFAWKCKVLKGVTLVTFNQLIKDVMALMV